MNIIRRLNVVLVLVVITGGAATAQTVRLNQVMRSKLQHSQRFSRRSSPATGLLDTESRRWRRSPGIRLVGPAVPGVRPSSGPWSARPTT